MTSNSRIRPRYLAGLLSLGSRLFGAGPLGYGQFRDLLQRYAFVGDRRDRFAIYGRLLCLRPIMAALQEHMPRQGRILDLGCGYGLTLHLLASLTMGEIWGIERDAQRASTARRSLRHSERTCVVQADLLSVAWPEAAGVLIADVLFMIPPEVRCSILRNCAKKLPAGGVLIIKDTGESPAWKFRYTQIEERWKLRLRAYGPEIAQQRHYFCEDELDAVATSTGFCRWAGNSIPALAPYPGVVYVYRRT